MLESDAHRYRDLTGLTFEWPRYEIRGGLRGQVRLLAPTVIVRSAGREFKLILFPAEFRFSGLRLLLLGVSARIAVAKLTVRVLDDGAMPANLVARLGEEEAESELRSAAQAGAGIVISLQNVDHGALRYR